jgi:hypothetical protein
VADSNAPEVPPAKVAVSCWGELAAEKRLGGVLRVLVDGQHAGAIRRDGDMWNASRQARALAPAKESQHATAGGAVRAVLRSGFARQLGARAASPVYWTEQARRELRRAT